MKEKIKHLLIPREFRIWCRPNHPIGEQDLTTKPSETGCANCLTAFRAKTTGKTQPFRTRHAHNRNPSQHYEEWRTPVLPENL